MATRKFLAAAFAVAVGFYTGAASAATVTPRLSSVFGTNGSAVVTIPTNWNVLAGGFDLKGDLDGNGSSENFIAWCLDIATSLNLYSPNNNYVISTDPFVDGVDLTATQISNIQKLYNTGFKTLVLSDPNQSAGFQLALWEIAYDTGLNITAGAFFASNNPGAIGVAAALLSGLGGPVTQQYKLTFLQSDPHRSQNLITASPIPIPAALPLLASGLVGFGMISWLRRRKRSTEHCA